MRSFRWLLVAILLVPATLAVLVLVVTIVTTRVFAFFTVPPPQPVNFWHTVHVNTVKLDCTFCHRNATTGRFAGIPPVEQCMFCHKVVARGQSEVEKVVKASETHQPIDWIRVYRLPDHVRFVHEAHIRAGFDCATCHGDVGNMVHVRQVRELKMGDCLGCHRANSAPTDCATCHY